MTTAEMTSTRLEELLGDDAASCSSTSPGDPRLEPPPSRPRTSSTGVWLDSDRTPQVLKNLQWLVTGAGRLAGTGYISILPSTRASSTPRRVRSPRTRVLRSGEHRRARARGRLQRRRLDVGVLGAVSRPLRPQAAVHRQAQPQRVPELSQRYDQIKFSASGARGTWARGRRRTIYFGSEESKRQIVEVAELFEEAHQLGMFTVLWCYVRNSAFKVDGVNYELSADLSGRPTTSA
jgi:class I fructose-bisphosphate aldolase